MAAPGAASDEDERTAFPWAGSARRRGANLLHGALGTALLALTAVGYFFGGFTGVVVWLGAVAAPALGLLAWQRWPSRVPKGGARLEASHEGLFSCDELVVPRADMVRAVVVPDGDRALVSVQRRQGFFVVVEAPDEATGHAIVAALGLSAERRRAAFLVDSPLATKCQSRGSSGRSASRSPGRRRGSSRGNSGPCCCSCRGIWPSWRLASFGDQDRHRRRAAVVVRAQNAHAVFCNREGDARRVGALFLAPGRPRGAHRRGVDGEPAVAIAAGAAVPGRLSRRVDRADPPREGGRRERGCHGARPARKGPLRVDGGAPRAHDPRRARGSARPRWCPRRCGRRSRMATRRRSSEPPRPSRCNLRSTREAARGCASPPRPWWPRGCAWPSPPPPRATKRACTKRSPRWSRADRRSAPRR